jgi:hypothetical protein
LLLRVTHETVYDYVPPVKNAQHMAHLKPLNGAHQQLLQHSLTISPQPAQQTEAVDLYGNTRAFFNLPAAHDALHVVAHSLVQTQPAEPPPASLPWEQVRERMRYQRGAAYDAATEFTFPSPYVPRHDDFVAYARPSFAADRPKPRTPVPDPASTTTSPTNRKPPTSTPRRWRPWPCARACARISPTS